MGKVFQCPKGGGALLEEASELKTCFQPGPRPARDAFNQGGLLINQELTLTLRGFSRTCVPGHANLCVKRHDYTHGVSVCVCVRVSDADIC